MHCSTRSVNWSPRRSSSPSDVSLVVCVLCNILCRLHGRNVYALIRDRHEEGGGVGEGGGKGGGGWGRGRGL